ncbi:MAG: carboxymuconolactone decarboxylase family protein [Gemmatimonadetes bacterium]|nr:carboxymuconolactone decarboxylase family protein [Gemmatimonadota bacterium]
MIRGGADAATLPFDGATRALVRLAARIAGGSELDVRDGLREARDADTPPAWVEELILQSYLFCGFPRTLNAAREWRRLAGRNEDEVEAKGRGLGGGTGDEVVGDFTVAGEATCARVYGKFYERLRHNIVELHPELDRWMIVEGYGKVLSRPGLDLGRRELCIVAACVASGQDRQLHSHLHGARNVGVADEVVDAAIDSLEGTVDAANLERAKMMWGKVGGRGRGAEG